MGVWQKVDQVVKIFTPGKRHDVDHPPHPINFLKNKNFNNIHLIEVKRLSNG